jgi:hypothetical protein
VGLAAFDEQARDEGGAELVRGVRVVQAVCEDDAPGLVSNVDETGFRVCGGVGNIGRGCGGWCETDSWVGRHAGLRS